LATVVAFLTTGRAVSFSFSVGFGLGVGKAKQPLILFFLALAQTYLVPISTLL